MSNIWNQFLTQGDYEKLAQDSDMDTDTDPVNTSINKSKSQSLLSKQIRANIFNCNFSDGSSLLNLTPDLQKNVTPELPRETIRNEDVNPLFDIDSGTKRNSRSH